MSLATAVRRRVIAHWAVPPVVALFLGVGALVIDDYNVSPDETDQREVGKAALDYLAGEGERAFDQLRVPHNRYYGAVLEAPLALLERIPGLEDPRDIALGRNFLTHLFFLTGGIVCYLLVLRLFSSRALALIAMILFLLHPRIYAHSFFNSKDVPFLVAFMLALYLVHRAFRRDTLGAFLLCGVGVGLLANLRIMGIILFVAVLALRALDLAFAGSAEERKRVLLAGGAFALAALLTYYASLPVLWTDPARRFAESIQLFGSHPYDPFNLFRGEWLYAPDGPPFDYVPVWVGITTPPATLLLATLGAVALVWRALRHPRLVLRNGPLRFGLLLVALPALTVIAVVVLENNVYEHWRQLYFLYAPLLLLATVGLHQITGSARGRWPRAGAYALTGAAIAVVLLSMARIHPHQNSSFTVLTDRTTPERLVSRYHMDTWKQSARALVANVLEDHPSGHIQIANLGGLRRQILPSDDRERLTTTHDFRSGQHNFYGLRIDQPCPALRPPAVSSYTVRLYASTFHCLVDPVAYFGNARRDALANEPFNRSLFDAYHIGDIMVYIRESCSTEDMDMRFFLYVYPVTPADLPGNSPLFAENRQYGFGKVNFNFRKYGARIDGNCVAIVPLPDYPIARIRTGQYTPEYVGTARRAVASDAPLTRSHFDVWLDASGRGLIYARDECSAEDVGARFFLHAYPADERNLPEQAEYGFANLDFNFPQYGVHTEDGGCIATVPLPAYPIANIQTGQFDGTGRLWTAEFALPDGE